MNKVVDDVEARYATGKYPGQRGQNRVVPRLMSPLSVNSDGGVFYIKARGIIMEQILSIVVRNQPGVLMRVAGMFSRRGYNIDSLAVGTTQNPEFSRMTVTMEADDAIITQVCKQLAKLVEVEAVKVLSPKESTRRSMTMVKVKATNNRLELLRLGDVFRANAVDVSEDALIFLATGDESKLNAFVDILKPYGILEMVQTGVVALERGTEALNVTESRFEWPVHVEHKMV